MEYAPIITRMPLEPVTPTAVLSEALLASGSEAIDRLKGASEEFRASEDAHRRSVYDLERATRKLEAELVSVETFFTAGYRAPEYRLPFIRSEHLPDFERRFAALRVLCRERELEDARAELEKLSNTAAPETIETEARP